MRGCWPDFDRCSSDAIDDLTPFERQIGDELRREIGPMPLFDAMAVARTSSSAAPRWPLGPVLGVARSVVGAAVVLIFGGVVLTGVLGTQSDDAVFPAIGPPASATPSDAWLPPVLSDGVERGTFDSPLGRMRWTHVTTDFEQTPEDLAETYRGMSGFVTVDERGVWRSSDLLSWTLGPFPDGSERGRLYPLPDGLLLATERPGGLYRSTDGLAWLPLDTSALRGIAGVDLFEPVALGERLVLPLSEDSGGPKPPRVGIIEEDHVTLVEIPAADIDSSNYAVGIVDDYLVALALTPDRLVRVLRSDDAITWEYVDVLGDDAGEPNDIWGVDTIDRQPRVFEPDGASWSMTDTWTWVREPAPESPSVAEFGHGARVTGGRLVLGSHSLWTLVDGATEWALTDVADLGIGVVEGRPDRVLSGVAWRQLGPDTFVLDLSDDDARRDLWFFSLEGGVPPETR